MFLPGDQGNRKRHRNGGPLSHTIVCLSGFPPETKAHYHSLIEQLGGRYTRDFTSNNTHLIAFEPVGAKYEAAQLLQRKIHIVRPSWLEACQAAGQHVTEMEHLLDSVEASILPAVSRKIRSNHDPYQISHSQSDIEDSTGVIQQLLEDSKHRDDSLLFSECRFYLVGFENDSESLLFGKLIRRGMGFVHWDFQSRVTHVVVKYNATLAVRDKVKSFITQLAYDKTTVAVSSRWLIDSWKANELVHPQQYPPVFQSATRENDMSENTNTINKAVEKSSALFKGLLFCFIRAVPPELAVDFDAVTLEKTVKLNGGQILSQKLLEALIADDRDTKRCSTAKRKLYIVCWGGAYEASHLDMHPLVSQVKRQNLCTIVPTTPIWLNTCVSMSMLVSPRHWTALFTPESSGYPWLALKPSVRIAITGFSGWRRSALIHFLNAVAVYDDSMTRNRTTHLIVQQAEGEKYTKAKEWGLYIVSPEWLYHIVQYGYSGKQTHDDLTDGDIPQNHSVGCEHRFPPSTLSTEPSI